MGKKPVRQGVDLHSRGRLVGLNKDKVRAALVVPDLYGGVDGRDVSIKKSEFEGLALAIGLDIVISEIVPIKRIKPSTYVGGGFINGLAKKIRDEKIELAIFNVALSPVQQRNLENKLKAKVLDRTALILEIFGERAATREGVLQVELAHLNYQKGRLVRSWTHLERQRGGGGFIGGPGETQIESDRRQIGERIKKLQERIDKISKTRKLQRKEREDVPFPLIALVGYTNAGKSTLFNRLTGADIMAKDLLFATLDTTVRKVVLPHSRQIILSDTVGFISQLPTELIAAFRATLEEVVRADIILHVRDVSSKDSLEQAKDVMNVLHSLGVDGEETPIIEVWNKIDKLNSTDLSELQISPQGKVYSHICVSAISGEGIDELLLEIEKVLAKDAPIFSVQIGHENGREVAWLYEHGEILSRKENNEATSFIVRIQPKYISALQKRFGKRLKAS